MKKSYIWSAVKTALLVPTVAGLSMQATAQEASDDSNLEVIQIEPAYTDGLGYEAVQDPLQAQADETKPLNDRPQK